MFEWDVPPEDAMEELYDDYARTIRYAIEKLITSFAPRIESWMKANAIWTDRTGDARKTLHTEVENLVGEITLYLSHGMDYGLWLEIANQGKYSVIGPALDYWTPKIWSQVKELLR